MNPPEDTSDFLPLPWHQVVMSVDFEAIFENSEPCDGRFASAIQGEVPRDLKGTLLRNGPGRFHSGKDAIAFFDACGIVATLTFQEGQATYRAQFVDTPTYKAETKAQKVMKRRAFTNLREGRNFLNMDLANPAMHDAFYFGGRLYATDDPGWFRMQPGTLATMGEDRFEKAAKTARMCAVPRVDRKHGRLLWYVAKPTPLGSATAEIIETDEAWNVVSSKTVSLVGNFGFIHEVTFTEDEYVLTEAPVKFNLLGALFGKPVFTCIQPSSMHATIHVIPRRQNAGTPKRFTTSNPTFFHCANAYRDGDELLVDGCNYPWTDFSGFMPKALRAAQPAPSPEPSFRRFRLHLGTGAVRETELCRYAELPRINPDYHGRRYQFAYLLASLSRGESPDDFVWAREVVKVEVQSGEKKTWTAGQHRFVSQPTFAPRPGSTREDDGWVLVWLVNVESRRAEVAILDAKTMEHCCTLDMGGYLSLASHCRFESEL